MIPIRQALRSSLGKKYVMGMSGLALVGFIIMHLAGNLTLLDPSGITFNRYAKGIHDFGYLMTLGEFALLFLFLIHIYMALTLKFNHSSARNESYTQWKSKGIQTSNVSSRNMIVSGIVLLTFLILHIYQFRFSPGVEMGYGIDIDGETAKDLFRIVSETFMNPINVIIYVVVMLLLGLHIRHGFWSAFQSLGLMYPRWSSSIYCFGFILAALLALGFIIIPIYIYFNVGGLL